MTGAESGDDRLSSIEFAELIQHLPMHEMFLIEYRTASVGWKKLFSRKRNNVNQFTCLLCKADASCFKNLLAHIAGRKHVQQMVICKSLYHPQYTHSKDADNSDADTSTTKEEDKTKTLKEAQAKVPSKPENKTNGKNELKTGKEVLPSKDELKTKVSNLVKNTVAPKKYESNSKTANIVKNPAAVIKHDVASIAPVMVKNPAALNKFGNSNKATKLVKNPAALKKGESASKTANLVRNPAALNKDNSTSKAAILVKNPAAINKCESASKTANIVKNPIATSKVFDVSSEDEPHYVQNKIIIPSVHKNKMSKDYRNPSPVKDPPQFADKTQSFTSGDDDIRGILGVEYVIELLSENDCAVRYECGLCEQVLDAFAMQRHLEGYNHRLKYCEKHFPTAINRFRLRMHGIPERDNFKILTPVLAKLAIAIEKYHGRQTPYKCYERDYAINRHDVLSKVYSCQHASELHGPDLIHTIDFKEVDKYINERNKYTPPTYSRSVIFSEDSLALNGRSANIKVSVNKGFNKNVMQQNNKMLVGKPPKIQNRNESFNTRTMPSNNYTDFSMPLPSRNSNIMLANNMESPPIIKPFVQNPLPVMQEYLPNNMTESFVPHPGFNYQMQTPTNFSFCNNQRSSVDDQTYNKMVDEFLQGTLKGNYGATSRKRSPHPSHSSGPPAKWQHIEVPLQSNKKDCAENKFGSLDLEFIKYRKDPETYPYYNDEWQQFWKRRKEELIATGKDHRNYNYQPEWVKFIKYRIEVAYRERLEIIRTQSKEHERVSHSSGANLDPFPKSANTNMHSSTNVPDNTLKAQADHLQVVSVLRLMAALEENLGSLGPKIITLLSKALQLEKTNKGDIIRSLLNDDNCSVIETAKEKFKGLLLTGIVEGSKQRAMKKAVEEAETLLSSTQRLRALSHSQTKHQQTKPQNQSVPSITDILKFLRAQSDQK